MCTQARRDHQARCRAGSERQPAVELEAVALLYGAAEEHEGEAVKDALRHVGRTSLALEDRAEDVDHADVGACRVRMKWSVVREAQLVAMTMRMRT